MNILSLILLFIDCFRMAVRHINKKRKRQEAPIEEVITEKSKLLWNRFTDKFTDDISWNKYVYDFIWFYWNKNLPRETCFWSMLFTLNKFNRIKNSAKVWHFAMPHVTNVTTGNVTWAGCHRVLNESSHSWQWKLIIGGAHPGFPGQGESLVTKSYP